VLSCQHTERHPFTGADPGGWGWSDLSGAVPDADDTPGALLALGIDSDWHHVVDDVDGRTVCDITIGVKWLLALQNRDGGWPTFCRGWGKLPFDRSGTDLTAHALRAFHSYEGILRTKSDDREVAGLIYLSRTQRPDGSWFPLWFGNQHGDDDENPLYGTARVLLAYRDLGRMSDREAQRGIDYLLGKQNSDGGWGGIGFRGEGGVGSGERRETTASAHVSSPLRPPPSPLVSSSVEETAVVVEALCAAGDRAEVRESLERGVAWLVEGVESDRFREPSPIGFYFAKLWYYEKLYPLIFTVGALRAVVELSGTDAQPPPASA